jgi:hypothetical protein
MSIYSRLFDQFRQLQLIKHAHFKNLKHELILQVNLLLLKIKQYSTFYFDFISFVKFFLLKNLYYILHFLLIYIKNLDLNNDKI